MSNRTADTINEQTREVFDAIKDYIDAPPEERPAQRPVKKRRGNIYPVAAVWVGPSVSRISSVKLGDVIWEKRDERRKKDLFAVERIEGYRVIAINPYHVLTVGMASGLKRCFCYGDLIIMGLERQSPELEAMRKLPLEEIEKRIGGAKLEAD